MFFVSVYEELGMQHWTWPVYLLLFHSLTFAFLELYAIIIYVIVTIKGTRIHWIEIHEESWCPAFLRQIIQSGLQIGWQFYGLHPCFGSPADSLARVIFDKLSELQCHSILDLCSGSCGPSAYLNYRINQKFREISGKSAKTSSNPSQASKSPAQVVTVLTDLYPFETSWQQLSQDYEFITYCPASVDATQVPLAHVSDILQRKQEQIRNKAVDGQESQTTRVRTLFGSFHHFGPEQAVGILSDAMKCGDAFIMAEMVINRRNIFDFIKWPVLMALTLPFNWLHLTLKYSEQQDRSVVMKVFDIVRMLLLTIVWYFIFTHDAIISCARIYLEPELIELSEKATDKVRNEVQVKDKEAKGVEFEWNAVRHNSRMLFPLNMMMPYTLLTGIPNAPHRQLRVKNKKQE